MAVDTLHVPLPEPAEACSPQEFPPYSSLPPTSSYAPRVEMLGSRENGMALVHPPTDETEVLDLLRKIDSMLQERRVQIDLQAWAKDKDADNSVRHIQGGRMEIFLSAHDKQSTFFDQKLGTRLPPGAKKLILQYARKQALKDPRLSTDYLFGNFSIIVCQDACDAQAPHLDLIAPNFQFGLILTEAACGTLFYESESHTTTADDLAEHWRSMALSLGQNCPDATEMPTALVEAIRKDQDTTMLLECFGDVLFNERQVLQKMKNKHNLPTGSLLSLPGGVVHAGPSSAGFRAVIFFSGWPNGSEIPPYDPDVQYTGTMLVGHLVSVLWRSDEVGFPERQYLLRRLAQYIENSTVSRIWCHFGPGALANFVGTIEEKGYKPVYSRDDYINHVAEDLTVGRPAGPFTDADTIDLSHFEQISVDNLFTVWSESDYHVVVLRRKADGKIVLRYPVQDDDDEYEGHRAEENYRLSMSDPTRQTLFDGSNGTLIDTDGNEVKMFTK